MKIHQSKAQLLAEIAYLRTQLNLQFDRVDRLNADINQLKEQILSMGGKVLSLPKGEE